MAALCGWGLGAGGKAAQLLERVVASVLIWHFGAWVSRLGRLVAREALEDDRVLLRVDVSTRARDGGHASPASSTAAWDER